MIIQGHDAPFSGYLKTFVKRNFTGVRKTQDILFRLIASGTSVEQIGVFTLPFRINAYRDKMFNMERPTPRVPLFTVEAVNATESEFVA